MVVLGRCCFRVAHTHTHGYRRRCEQCVATTTRGGMATLLVVVHAPGSTITKHGHRQHNDQSSHIAFTESVVSPHAHHHNHADCAPPADPPSWESVLAECQHIAAITGATSLRRDDVRLTGRFVRKVAGVLTSLTDENPGQPYSDVDSSGVLGGCWMSHYHHHAGQS